MIAWLMSKGDKGDKCLIWQGVL